MKGRRNLWRSAILRNLVPAVLLVLLISASAISCSSPLTSSDAANESSQVNRATSSAAIDFREESIYFLLPTRFIDGDSSNNVPTEWCSYTPFNTASTITDPKDVTWRGDFRGLIDTGLNYIADLGFTAVWLTPIVQNRGPLDYHGYHAWDFNKVDPRLETPGYTYQDFINKAHSLGLKVVQDVVWNHSGRYGIKGVAELKYNTDPTKPWYAPPNPNWEYDGKTPNPVDGKIWSRANLAPMPAPYNANLALYNWPGTEAFVSTSDINWFHHSGNGYAQGWDDTVNLYERALADDCPDLNTESVYVRNYLVNAYKKYLDMGVDAFRVDTVKHMDRASVQYFIDQFKAYKPNLFIFGEVAQKRHELHSVEEINPHWYTWKGAVGASANSGMAVLDFYAQATFHNVFEEGGGLGGAAAAARYDHLYSDASTNVMWLDNHDFGPNNDWNRRYSGNAEGLASYVNFTWTWRGIPTLYYGSEIQFMQGAYTDIHEAADINKTLDTTGRAFYGNQVANAPNHKLYQHIKKMNAIRKAIPALQKGTWSWAGNPSSGDGIGYTRTFEGQVVAVGLAKGSTVSFNFSGLPAGTYRDAVTGTVIQSGGSLSFSVSPGSAGVYVLNGPGMIGALGAGFFQTTSNGGGGGGGETGWTTAYFRGTPNNWSATAMTKNTTTSLWETTQVFGSDSPRFKITKNNDWVEAYPATDFLITGGAGTYKITFNETTKAITAVKQGTTTYSISGTVTLNSAGLAGVTMTAGGKTAVTAANGTFTIADLVAGSYTLTPSLSGYTFSPVNRAVSIVAANITGQTFAATATGGFQWSAAYFRGTPNAWGTTAMTKTATAGVWETTQVFGTDSPRFKVTKNTDWVEAYPATDYLITGGAGTYRITFNDNTKAITVTKQGETIPAAPTSLTATAVSASQINLSWTASSGAASYNVLRSATSTGTYTAIANVTGTTYSNTALVASTAYYYRVTATNGAGTSPVSNTASATTQGSGTVTTTIRVNYDAGTGNTIAVRGSLSPLNWTTGAAATWTTGNVWVYTTTAIPAGTAFEFKALINDSRWSDGANFSGVGGNTINVYPTYNGNFYDIMDTISTNWAISGGTTTYKWYQGTGVAQARATSAISYLTQKTAMNKQGTAVTLALKYKTAGLDTGEYLRVQVLKGTTWTTVATYTGTKDWTNVSIDITAYQSSAMKLRFLSYMNGTDEYVYVDNVTVSVR